MNFIKRFSKQKMKCLSISALAFAFISMPSIAHAACSNPAGVAGDIMFNDDTNTMQYCNDVTWTPMGAYNKIKGPADGLVGYWKLDETSGTVIKDYAGSNDGTWDEGASGDDNVANDSTSAKVDRGLTFDYTKDWITTNLSVGALPNKTYSGWFYWTADNEWQTMILEGESFSSDGYVGLSTSGTDSNKRINLYQSYGPTGTANLYCSSNYSPPLNQWIHVAGTIDKANDLAKIYINGLLIETCSDGMPGKTFYDPTNFNITMSSAGNGGGDLGGIFWGKMDDIRVYNRALTKKEVLDLYEATNYGETGAALTVRGRGAAPATYTGSMEEMVVSGNYAYLASYADPNNYENGLHVFDISDPDNPTHVGFTFVFQREISPTNALDRSETIHINKNDADYLYVMDSSTCRTMEFQAVDISDPTNPTPTNHVLGDVGESYFIFAHANIGNQDGDLIWGVSGHECASPPVPAASTTRPALWAVDVSDPATPVIAHWRAPAAGLELHNVEWIHVDDGIAVVTFNTSSPRINTYDVSNPASITLLDSFTHPNILNAREVWHDGQYAYVIEKINDYLLVLDISNPSSISLVASVPIGNQPEHLHKKGNYIYTNGQLDDSIEIVDVSDPPNAFVAHVVSDPSLEEVDTVYVYGDYIYGGVRGAGGLGVTVVNDIATNDGLCVGPDGQKGDIIYNDTNHVMEYCNGQKWVAMGPIGNGGAGGCSSPNNDEGTMIYNTAFNVMQYCEGDDWVAIGKP